MNIELEITLRCNATCPSCSRHTHLSEYKNSDMTLEQIDKFIQEVKNHNNIDLISVMGGEPTVHPFFEVIIFKLYEELLQKKYIKRLQIITNGKIEVSSSISKIISVIKYPQEFKGNEHRCQFVAPIDTGQILKEYACDIPQVCGLGFNAYGCNPCGAGGAIARLFGLQKYIMYSLPKNVEEFGDLYDLCKYCQVKAQKYLYYKDYRDIQSISFRNMFNDFKNKIKFLRKY